MFVFTEKDAAPHTLRRVDVKHSATTPRARPRRALDILAAARPSMRPSPYAAQNHLARRAYLQAHT